MISQQDLISLVAGAWYLLNSTAYYPNGTEVTDPDSMLGPKPIGMLTYTPTGYMGANIMSSNPEHRPQSLTYPAQENQTDAEWALVGLHTLAYAGPFSFNNGSTPLWGQLTHGPLTIADVPSMVGTRQLRNYTVHENGRVLQINVTRAETGVMGILNWEKLS